LPLPEIIMPRSLLPTQQEHVEVVLRGGCTDYQKLAEDVGCSKSQIVKMKANLTRFDSVVRPKFFTHGVPRKITPAMETVSALVPRRDMSADSF
jgi:hypothetical protein